VVGLKFGRKTMRKNALSPFFLSFNFKLFASVFSVFLFVSFVQSVLCSSPVWFSEGVYARYEFKTSLIWFYNDTYERSYSHVAYEWRCVSLEGDVAGLNVSVTFDHTVQISTLVYVNTEDRNVTLLDGSYLGKTWLWLPASPRQNETILLTDSKTAKIRIEGWMATPQGAQKSFYAINYPIGGGYDLDTGVLITSSFREEPTLRPLNIRDLGLSGSTSFVATNIDLGPREWLMDLLSAIPYTLPFIAFIVTFAFLLYKKQQKKKRKTALKAKQHKLPPK
jgi:hypothetical protein